MTESEAREAVVREALSWIGTPYVSGADVRGAGVDCGMLLVRVYADLGIIPPVDPRPYPEQWHVHQQEERYLGWVERWGTEVPTPEPGDVTLFKFGRVYSHGAIVVAWPVIVHITRPSTCCRADVSRDSLGKHSLMSLGQRYFSPWGK